MIQIQAGVIRNTRGGHCAVQRLQDACKPNEQVVTTHHVDERILACASAIDEIQYWDLELVVAQLWVVYGEELTEDEAFLEQAVIEGSATAHD